MTFDEAMVLTRSVSSHTAFEDEECCAYWDILVEQPKNALIVEIGLEFGRSSSVALQAAKERELRYHGIDPFLVAGSYEKWMTMAEEVGIRFQLSKMRSEDVKIGEAISVILIDGDHSDTAVKRDCEHFLPQVRSGGFALFHDWNRGMGVESAAGEYFALHSDDWIALGCVITMSAWRKV